MKLEDGKTYKNRMGDKITVFFSKSETGFCFWAKGDVFYDGWREDGTYSLWPDEQSPLDLIEEVNRDENERTT